MSRPNRTEHCDASNNVVCNLSAERARESGSGRLVVGSTRPDEQSLTDFALTFLFDTISKLG